MRLPRVLLLAVLSMAACGDNIDGFSATPGFVLSTSGQFDATLEAADKYQWWWNSVPDADYESWWTDYDATKWATKSASAHIVVTQSEQAPLTAQLTLDGDHTLDFAHPEIGLGWRQVTTKDGETQTLDLHSAGLAPARETLDRYDLAGCSISDARVLVALSQYPGTMEELIAEATASALDQGLPEPRKWSDLVGDELMYEKLFGEHKTHEVNEATFAFVALQLDPVCGSLRMTFQTERGLVGPVERIAE